MRSRRRRATTPSGRASCDAPPTRRRDPGDSPESTPSGRLAERCSNWGRWGPDDELGTLNHIRPRTSSRRPARPRRAGFSLSIPLDEKGPADRRLRPLQPDPPDDPRRQRGGHRHGRPRLLRRPGSLDPRHRRPADPAAAVRHAVGRARPHRVRRPDLQRLRRDRSSAARARSATTSPTRATASSDGASCWTSRGVRAGPGSIPASRSTPPISRRAPRARA